MYEHLFFQCAFIGSLPGNADRVSQLLRNSGVSVWLAHTGFAVLLERTLKDLPASMCRVVPASVDASIMAGCTCQR